MIRAFTLPRRRAFTLIELTVVLGMLATLMSVGIINLLRTQQVARLASSTTQIVADIKAQQLRAMTGDTEGTGTIQPHGIYIQPSSYVLFRSTSYSPSEPSNFTVSLEPNVSLSSTIPSSTLVFLSGSGEMAGYTAGFDTITLADTTSSETVTFQFNRYGVIISDY